MRKRTPGDAQSRFLLLPPIDGSAQAVANNESHAADIGQVCAAEPDELTPWAGHQIIDALHRRFYEEFAGVE